MALKAVALTRPLVASGSATRIAARGMRSANSINHRLSQYGLGRQHRALRRWLPAGTWCRAEGGNVAVEYRWANNQHDRLPALAANLVNRRVAVIVTTAGTPAIRSAKAATSIIPIVFVIGGDPARMQRVPRRHYLLRR